MRLLTLSLGLAVALSAPAYADQFVVESRVTSVVLNPDGAQITRTIDVDVSAGRHEIVVTGLEASGFVYYGWSMPPIDTGTSGAVVEAVGFLDGDLFLTAPHETEREKALKADLDRALAAQRDLIYRKKALEAEREAAQGRIAYLKSLNATPSESTGASPTASDVNAVLQAIGTEYLAALKSILDAERAIEEMADVLQKAGEAVEIAEARYEAAKSEVTEIQYAPTLILNFPSAYAGPILLQDQDYSSDVQWQPTYDLELSQDGASGKVRLVRKATLSFGDSTTVYENVKVTLSTAAILKKGAVDDPFSKAGGLNEKLPPEPREPEEGGFNAPLMEPLVVSKPVIKGQVLEFELPGLYGTDVGGRVQSVTLDTLEFNVALSAKIVSDETEDAFLIARLTNTSGGPLLPGDYAIYRDGVYIGKGTMEAVGIGEEIELSFGAYDGIEVRRDGIERMDGDVGIISSSNRRVIRHRTTVTSHLGFALPVRMLDGAPYSTDEDLVIKVLANPAPTERDVDGKRGVVAWEFDLGPGQAKAVEFGYDATWPSDKDFFQN